MGIDPYSAVVIGKKAMVHIDIVKVPVIASLHTGITLLIVQIVQIYAFVKFLKGDVFELEYLACVIGFRTRHGIYRGHADSLNAVCSGGTSSCFSVKRRIAEKLDISNPDLISASADPEDRLIIVSETYPG
jgi:hypothetical protein